jgi:hypothetical protein
VRQTNDWFEFDYVVCKTVSFIEGRGGGDFIQYYLVYGHICIIETGHRESLYMCGPSYITVIAGFAYCPDIAISLGGFFKYSTHCQKNPQ